MSGVEQSPKNTTDSTKLITEEAQPQYSSFSQSQIASSSMTTNSPAKPVDNTTSSKNKGFVFSLLLENKGSTARDHLANERTFLAWLRTSLALVTIGIAVTQFSKISASKPDSDSGEEKRLFQLLLGSLYMVVGVIFVFFGLARYFYIQHQLTQGKFPASRYTIILGVLLLLLISATLAYTFIGDVF